MSEIPLIQRCGAKNRHRHKYNLRIYREQYIPESEFEPDLIRDTEFIKDTLHPIERKEMQQK